MPVAGSGEANAHAGDAKNSKRTDRVQHQGSERHGRKPQHLHADGTYRNRSHSGDDSSREHAFQFRDAGVLPETAIETSEVGNGDAQRQ